jgi:hypothetical protein
MSINRSLSAIHESLVNGQRKQMVEQIDSVFIQYDFWDLFLDYLKEVYCNDSEKVLADFSDAVISYHRIYK